MLDILLGMGIKKNIKRIKKNIKRIKQNIRRIKKNIGVQWGNEEAKKRRDEESKRRRDEETKKWRNEETKKWSKRRNEDWRNKEKTSSLWSALRRFSLDQRNPSEAAWNLPWITTTTSCYPVGSANSRGCENGSEMDPISHTIPGFPDALLMPTLATPGKQWVERCMRPFLVPEKHSHEIRLRSFRQFLQLFWRTSSIAVQTYVSMWHWDIACLFSLRFGAVGSWLSSADRRMVGSNLEDSLCSWSTWATQFTIAWNSSMHGFVGLAS